MFWRFAPPRAAMVLALATSGASADPRTDCEISISALGYPLVGYVFEAAGIFKMERHHIGGVTCYIDVNGKVDSLYIGETVLAEDGYFGPDALQQRDRINERVQYELNFERARRDSIITNLRAEFDEYEATTIAKMGDDLDEIRSKSDPFNAGTPAFISDGRLNSDAPSPNTDLPDVDHDLTATASLEAAPSSNRVAVAEVERRYVAIDRLMRRTCPSSRCGSVGALWFREAVDVLEEKDGWVRFTEPQPAVCQDGISTMLESGDTRCSPENGITNDQFSLWVFSDYLVIERPADPADTAAPDEDLVKNSDDFGKYRAAFVTAANDLMEAGTCARSDFENTGGWMKSTGANLNNPIYFVYCGGVTQADKIELNAETGMVNR